MTGLTYLIAGLAFLVGAGLAIGLIFILQSKAGQSRIKTSELHAKTILTNAEIESQQLALETKAELEKYKTEIDRDLERRQTNIRREEDRLQSRREQLDSKYEKLEEKEQRLNKRQSLIDKRHAELDKLRDERVEALERVGEMSREEAFQHLLQIVEEEARNDMARHYREVEDELNITADAKARELIAMAIQRVASEYVADVTISVVSLPSDEMKGRIIGRNGRNIRSFEQAAGVDVVVDDTPEAVTISSFDPVRREIARRAMERLIVDGRIHPARIEKLLEEAEKEVEGVIREEGERAAYDAGVPGLHIEVMKMLGRLKFRTSYGQEQLAHAVESARLAGVLAAELGADVTIAKMGGLLHDIGKAMDHEYEGTHAQIGADFCRRYGVPETVVNCIESHHHEADQNSVEAIIVEAADAISGARPGARRESLENYLKRVRSLEDIANSFEGVNQSYALQAGREVRIIVRPDDIDDMTAIRLSKDIAKQIEETMQYPGQIKVTVIRETRAVDYAK